MRSIGASVFAAILGSLLTVLWMEGAIPPVRVAHAQAGSGPLLAPPSQRSIPPAQSPPLLQGLTPDEQVNVDVYERTNRSVVNISTLTLRPDGWLLRPLPSEGNGSGSVIDKNGHILTNNHVISDAKQVVVTLYNEESYPAKLVGSDPINDVAVIKIDAPPEELFPMTLGDSDALRVGLRVFALGNPFGLNRTMSTGIIASLNRTLEVQENWIIKSIIQIDASINPGSSGGPLLDTHGRLIGMNTAIATGDSRNMRQSAGIGFAIPVNLIRRVIPELIQHGRVIRGDLGITHVTETDDGLRIARLEPGGPAAQAGLHDAKVTRQRQGPFVFERIDRSTADVITAVDGVEVKTAAEFLGMIEEKKPGQVVELTILRDGQSQKIVVTLGSDEPALTPAPKERST